MVNISLIADAILNHKYGESFVAESAGFRKKDINPLAIEVMKEYGLDISNKSVDALLDFYNQGRKYDYVITVCNRGEEEEKLEMARKLRDDIAKRIDEFVNTVK